MEGILKKYVSVCLMVILALSLAGCGQTSNDEANQSSVSGDNVIFSQYGGLYESEFQLELSNNVENGIIRYTLDGSDPTSESTEYTEDITIADRTDEEDLLSAITSSGSGSNNLGGMPDNGGEDIDMPGEMPEGDFQNDNMELPEMADSGETPAKDDMPQRGDTDDMERTDGGGLPGASGTTTAPAENVFKGTVVKAAVFSKDGEMLSEVQTESYFVSEDIFTRYGDLPIVSIATDADNFFDDETGIYVNYNESGSDWEREVYFEMFEADGTSAISQGMGVRLNGGTTRSL